MDDAAQAQPLLLPDPGKYFMLAMRHGSVELACCISRSQIDDDRSFAAIAMTLRDYVKSQLPKKED